MQVLKPICDITEDKEAREAAERFKQKAAVVSARRRGTTWEVPPGLVATHVMPGHISAFLCTLYEDYELFERGGHIPLGVHFLV